jgi:peptide/nickel transport system permease protein
MLRYALRRVLWAIPTLIATSLILFLVTTLAPDPDEGAAVAAAARDDAPRGAALEEARRSQFLDLPRFMNLNPRDVQSRARGALAAIAADTDRGGVAAAELERLGAAALPYVIPLLETLPPAARGRVAVALAPVGERMGVVRSEDVQTQEAAVLFWAHFWENRSLDFSRGGVARAVARLVEHGSDQREGDLASLDTFALPEIVRAMTPAQHAIALVRLTRLARHATGRGEVIAADASPEERRRVLGDWHEWWFVHATDFVALDGVVRTTAILSDTRYGKWLDRFRSGRLGLSVVDGEPIADKLRARAPVTLLVCALAMLASWTISVPLGALGAWKRGGSFDLASSAVLFVLYTTPTFAVAELLRRASAPSAVDGGRLALATVALTLGSLAALARWQRAAMLEVVRQDFVRTARAKGLSAWRVAVVHALRNALRPMVAIGGLHLPVLLGGAFVVEEVFGLRGVGYETLRAIEAHDSPWLMAVVLASAVTVTVGLLASDLVVGALDPRVRELLTTRDARSSG